MNHGQGNSDMQNTDFGPQGSPLSVAIAQRDRDALNLVREALQKKRVRLAFQPIVQANCPDRMAFYEGLLRVMDPTGRVIPAKDFIDSVEDTEMYWTGDCKTTQPLLND